MDELTLNNDGISANSLFHFTSSKKNIENILKNGFYVKYSLEDYSTITDIVGSAAVAIPMTCFCDIPLSQIKYHTSVYGSYALGMRKQWGMHNKINPVIYTFKNAMTSELLNSVSEYIKNGFSQQSDIFKDIKEISEASIYKFFEIFTKAISNVEDLAKFTKPYQGRLWRNGVLSEKEVLFYNEREWRFLPTQDFFRKHNLKDKYSKDIFLDVRKRRAINLTMQKLLKLHFQPQDIKYIIVKSEDEIPEMVENLRDTFKDTATHSALQLLYTRIFSLDQITQDM